jgi:hypothetical protein
VAAEKPVKRVLVAKRPGQTLVAEAGTDTGSFTAKGWIIENGKASPVGIQQAIKQGSWKAAKGAAPKVDYPPIPADKPKP